MIPYVIIGVVVLFVLAIIGYMSEKKKIEMEMQSGYDISNSIATNVDQVESVSPVSAPVVNEPASALVEQPVQQVVQPAVAQVQAAPAQLPATPVVNEQKTEEQNIQQIVQQFVNPAENAVTNNIQNN